MNSERDDSEFRTLFADIRAHDASQCPDFEKTWQGARRRLSPSDIRPRYRLGLAIAVSLVVLAAASLVLYALKTARRRSASPPRTAEFAERTSSTPLPEPFRPELKEPR